MSQIARDQRAGTSLSINTQQRREGTRSYRRTDLRHVVDRKIAEQNAGMCSNSSWLERLKQCGPMLHLFKPYPKDVAYTNVCKVCTTVVPVKTEHVPRPKAGLTYVYMQRKYGQDCGREFCIYSEKFDGCKYSRPAQEKPAEPVEFTLPKGWQLDDAPIPGLELMRWKESDTADFTLPSGQSLPALPQRNAEPRQQRRGLRNSISECCMKEYEKARVKFAVPLDNRHLYSSLPAGRWAREDGRDGLRRSARMSTSSQRKHKPPPLPLPLIRIEHADCDEGEVSEYSEDGYTDSEEDYADPSVDEFGVFIV